MLELVTQSKRFKEELSDCQGTFEHTTPNMLEQFETNFWA